jgi:hypothetical protein
MSLYAAQPVCKPCKPHISQVACTWALLTQEDGYKLRREDVDRALL